MVHKTVESKEMKIREVFDFRERMIIRNALTHSIRDTEKNQKALADYERKYDETHTKKEIAFRKKLDKNVIEVKQRVLRRIDKSMEMI